MFLLAHVVRGDLYNALEQNPLQISVGCCRDTRESAASSRWALVIRGGRSGTFHVVRGRPAPPYIRLRVQKFEKFRICCHPSFSSSTMFAAARSLRPAVSRSGNYAVRMTCAVLGVYWAVLTCHAGYPAVHDCQEYELQGQRSVTRHILLLALDTKADVSMQAPWSVLTLVPQILALRSWRARPSG